MFLKKLEINGFKSFAKKTVLEFEPGVTSVVGPNGSGKSNIADSLRWVFGEQSMKTLRGKKSEDVIFAGSDQKSRLGGASVFIYFDNKDHKIPIDYDEVVIGRRLYRDGNSEYLINSNKVRLIDIQELLLKSGLGQTSYYVIGQGMIDQLVLGGPAAVKEVLEEAAGVKPYYVKRERTLRRLLRTETNLEQAEALVKEIEPRLRSLRRQTKRYEQRDDLERELREAQAMQFGSQVKGLDGQLGSIQEKDKLFHTQTEELNAEMESLKKEIENEERETENSGSVSQKQEQELSELRKAKQKFLEEQAILRGKLQSIPKGQNEAIVDWASFRLDFQKIYQDLQSVFKRITDAPQDFAVWQNDVTGLQGRFEKLIKVLEPDESRGVDLTKDEGQLKVLDREVKKIASEIEKLEQTLSQQSQHDSERKQQLFVKERLLRTKQDNFVKTREQQNSLSIEIARLQTRKESILAEAKEALGQDFQTLISEFQNQPLPAGLLEKIQRLRGQLEGIGKIDDLTMQEYQETEDRYKYLTEQSKDLEKGVKDLREAIFELDEIIKRDFNEAFQKISIKFSEYFRILFGGGKATMTLIRQREQQGEEKNMEKELEEELMDKKLSAEIAGVVIKATPPGKKLSGIAALSGGERALTSIALLSAILATSPSPFVVLDEVDAALDEANSIRFGKIIGELRGGTQFITITHNRETMRQSHTLYGVTMGDDGVSRVLSLKLEQAAVYSTKN